MWVYLALLEDRETILKSPLNICLSTTYITKSNFRGFHIKRGNPLEGGSTSKRRKPPTISLQNPDKRWNPQKRWKPPRGFPLAQTQWSIHFFNLKSSYEYTFWSRASSMLLKTTLMSEEVVIRHFGKPTKNIYFQINFFIQKNSEMDLPLPLWPQNLRLKNFIHNLKLGYWWS